mgnify:CR=1 FL=1
MTKKYTPHKNFSYDRSIFVCHHCRTHFKFLPLPSLGIRCPWVPCTTCIFGPQQRKIKVDEIKLYTYKISFSPYTKGQEISEWKYEVVTLNEIIWKFLLILRAEFFKFFHSYFGQCNDFIFSFWSFLTFQRLKGIGKKMFYKTPYLQRFHEIILRWQMPQQCYWQDSAQVFPFPISWVSGF